MQKAPAINSEEGKDILEIESNTWFSGNVKLCEILAAIFWVCKTEIENVKLN